MGLVQQLKRSLENNLSNSTLTLQRNADSSREEGEKAIAAWYKTGGKNFAQWVSTEYRTHKGEMMHSLEPFWNDLLLVMGNPWLEQVFLQKAAQMGYSEGTFALAIFVVSTLRLSVGLGFEQQGKMQEMVGERILPAIAFIPQVLKLRSNYGQKDRANTSAITIAGALLWFFYAGTQTKTSTYTQAPSTLRSKPANMIIADEWGLYPPGILDVAISRMNASELPTKLVRAGSTPGEEGGVVDREVKVSTYVFEWTVYCRSCRTKQVLTPYGNFLKSQETEEGETYLDSLGYPLDWFHSNPNNKLGSAFIGCQHCQKKLSRKSIVQGKFICSKTGTPLRDFLKDTVKNQIPVTDSVALILPRLASRLFIPEERIRRLLKTRNPTDELQQGLGVAASVGKGKISVGILHKCVNLTPPEREHDFITAGVDVGRNCIFAVVCKWWFADDPDKEIKHREAFKQIIFAGRIMGHEDALDELVEAYSVDFLGMDNEPEYNMATGYALEHRASGYAELGIKGQTYLFDQIQMKGTQFNRTIRKTYSALKGRKARKEGNDVVVYNIDRTYFLDRVRGRLYKKQQSFPEGSIYDSSDEENLLFHYTTSDRLDGVWIQSGQAPDHFFHADSFGEAVAMVSMYEPGMRGVVF